MIIVEKTGQELVAVIQNTKSWMGQVRHSIRKALGDTGRVES